MNIIKKIFLLAAAAIIAAVILYPLAFTFVNSFFIRNANEIYFSFDNYAETLADKSPFYRSFINSAVYSVVITGAGTIIACLGAYSFAFFEFKMKKLLFAVIILIMLTPIQVTLIPNFIVFDKLGLLDTPFSIILAGSFSAFGIFLLKQYMENFDKAIIEAAQIDGAGRLKILTHIVAPFSINGITALVILLFSESWSMVEQPVMFLSDKDLMPLSIYIRQVYLASQSKIFAPSILALIPIIIIFALFKTQLSEALSTYNFTA